MSHNKSSASNPSSSSQKSSRTPPVPPPKKSSLVHSIVSQAAKHLTPSSPTPSSSLSINTEDSPEQSPEHIKNDPNDKNRQVHSARHAKKSTSPTTSNASSTSPPNPKSHNLPFTEDREEQELSAAEQEEEDQITLATTFQSFKDMMGQQSWSLPELLFGIRWLHRGKEKRDFTPFVEKAVPIDKSVYEWLLYYEHHCRICNCFDVKPREEFITLAGLEDIDCIEYHVHSTSERNGYTIVLDHEFKEVVLYINGTQTLRDMMVDLHGKACAFQNGYAHHGMALWAKWFYKNKADTLAELLEKHEGYSLVICGHSLGASTSVLAGFLMRERFPDLEVIAIAVPKCISESLVKEAEQFVTSFCLMDDFVPLMSESTWAELRQRVAQCNWKHYFYNDISKAGAFKAFLKIAPTRFHRFWNKLGEEACKKMSEDELAMEYKARSFSEKEKVDHYYQKHMRSRTNSVSTVFSGKNKGENSPSSDPGSPRMQGASPRESALSPLASDDDLSARKRSVSAPQRPVRPLGALHLDKSITKYTSSTKTYTSSPRGEVHKSQDNKTITTSTSYDTKGNSKSSEDLSEEHEEIHVTPRNSASSEKSATKSESPKSANSDTPKDLGGNPKQSDDAFEKDDEAQEKAEVQSEGSEHGGPPKIVETEDDKLVALYNPGVIYYIRNVEDKWYMTKESWNSPYFEKLEFNRTFLKDHLCASYLKGMKNLLHSYKSVKEMDDKKEAQKKFLALQETNDLL